jgi:hypothetical protein
MNRLFFKPEQAGMTKTDAAIDTLSDINPDVNLEGYCSNICTVDGFAGFVKSLHGPDGTLLNSQKTRIDGAVLEWTRRGLPSAAPRFLRGGGAPARKTAMWPNPESHDGDRAGKSRVDLILSCVDNYEARMVVNQVLLSMPGCA